MGELSRELPKAAPRIKSDARTQSDSKSTALADLGVTKQRASEWALLGPTSGLRRNQRTSLVVNVEVRTADL